MKSDTYKVDQEKAKAARQKKYKTQEDMAAEKIEIRGVKEGLSIRSISSIETGGEVKPKSVKIFAKLCGVSIEDILSDDDEYLKKSEGNVNIVGRRIFGAASKSAMMAFRRFYEESRIDGDWYEEISNLEWQLWDIVSVTDALPATYKRIFELHSLQTTPYYISNNDPAREESKDFPGTIEITNSAIWAVQDDLVLTEPAIVLLRKLKDVFEPESLNEISSFSLDALALEMESRMRGVEYLDELEKTHKLAFFTANLKSVVFVDANKTFVRAHEDSWVDTIESEKVTSDITRPIIILGHAANTKITVQYDSYYAAI